MYSFDSKLSLPIAQSHSQLHMQVLNLMKTFIVGKHYRFITLAGFVLIECR